MALPELNSKVDESLRFPEHGTVIDGILAAQAIDTSAELIDIKGCDISSLNDDGVLNTEHISPEFKQFKEAKGEEPGFWSTIIGRIIFAKKIFTEEDCESQRELQYWRSVRLPFIYSAFELFDNENHRNAKDAAAMIKHYSERGLPLTLRFSIEGNTINRDGNLLLETVARRAALTLKPCNKAAISGFVAPAIQEQTVKSEINNSLESFTSYFTLDADPLVKVLSLGSYNGAPGSLSQGAALSVEDIGGRKKKKFFKAQILAAFRDWDHKEPFTKFLKHKMPEISDDFLDNFLNIMNSIKIKKNELHKGEVFEGDANASHNGLKPLPSSPSKANLFRGKHVKPGEAEIIRGPLQGKKLKVFHMDDSHVYLEPPQSGNSSVKVQKTPRKLEGVHYVINKDPEVLSTPVFVDAAKHAHAQSTESQEQKELMHGIDVSIPSNKKLALAQSTSSIAKNKGLIGWYKNAQGKDVYVKPEIEHPVDSMRPKDAHYLSTPEREAKFHNVANNFWGLGEYVPKTGVFEHPETGLKHSVMEVIPQSSHFKKQGQKHLKQHLKNLSGNGTLDKLAVMDIVMGQSDRNARNYLLSNHAPNIHLIDNALSFDYSDLFVPHYLHDSHGLNNQDSHEVQMHPQSLKWLRSLDPYALGAELTRQGVHPVLTNQAVARLLSMQTEAALGHTKLNDILFSHRRFLNA